MSQVYRARPSGSVVEQLTRHDDPLTTISYLVWSPDDQRLAYSAIDSDDAGHISGWIGIIPIGGAEAVRVAPDGFPGAKATRLYWSQDGSQLMFLSESSDCHQSIYWVDAENGIILDAITLQDVPVDSFDNVYPAGSINKVVIQSYVDIYLFDRNGRQIEWLSSYEPEGFFLIRESSSSPDSFDGEESCP